MVFAYNISLCEYGKRTLPNKFALLVPLRHASCFFSGLSVFIVFASDQSVTRTDWSRPEVSIHGAGQEDRSLWGRECSLTWKREISKFNVLTTTWTHNSKSFIPGSIFTSTALLPVHLQRALLAIKDARKKQYWQNSQHFPNVSFQVMFSFPLPSLLLKLPIIQWMTQLILLALVRWMEWFI